MSGSHISLVSFMQSVDVRHVLCYSRSLNCFVNFNIDHKAMEGKITSIRNGKLVLSKSRGCRALSLPCIVSISDALDFVFLFLFSCIHMIDGLS